MRFKFMDTVIINDGLFYVGVYGTILECKINDTTVTYRVRLNFNEQPWINGEFLTKTNN